MCLCVVTWLRGVVVTHRHRGLFQGGCVARRGVERLVVQLVQVVLVDAGQAGAVATVQPLVRPHGKRAATQDERRVNAAGCGNRNWILTSCGTAQGRPRTIKLT